MVATGIIAPVLEHEGGLPKRADQALISPSKREHFHNSTSVLGAQHPAGQFPYEDLLPPAARAALHSPANMYTLDRDIPPGHWIRPYWTRFDGSDRWAFGLEPIPTYRCYMNHPKTGKLMQADVWGAFAISASQIIRPDRIEWHLLGEVEGSIETEADPTETFERDSRSWDSWLED